MCTEMGVRVSIPGLDDRLDTPFIDGLEVVLQEVCAHCPECEGQQYDCEFGYMECEECLEAALSVMCGHDED